MRVALMNHRGFLRNVTVALAGGTLASIGIVHALAQPVNRPAGIRFGVQLHVHTQL
jgi:hypothetical protein